MGHRKHSPRKGADGNTNTITTTTSATSTSSAGPQTRRL
ncbi:hypothetical protein E2C01_062725 [Portunus trituberculatus]|uniref:Uncharacterized protein n=1 Tax=Portunus trituberculatus TaxID=210409 RepID=A0A5B7HEH2_PORTR|nr:hypothetical protein [Portunus trituberculatus]